MSRVNHRRAVLVGFAAGVLTLASVGAGHARRFRVGRGLVTRGPKTYTPTTLTQAQLESCLREEKKLDVLEPQISASEADINRRQVALQSRKVMIDTRRSMVDRYSQRSVDEYNSLIEQFEKDRQEFNSLVVKHNALVEASRVSASNFNSICANKQYYEDDMVAARLAVERG